MFLKASNLVFCILLAFATISYVSSQTEDDFYYPCDLGDYPCIATNLADNSACDTLVFGSLEPQYGAINAQYQVPFVNATYLDQYSFTGNIDKCYVSAFFFNLTADILVMGLTCPGLTFEAANRQIIQHYPNDANQYFSVHYSAQFPSVVFTANFYHASSIDFCNSFVFTYIASRPKYQITPNNPPSETFTLQDVNGALDHLLVYIREEALTQGPPIFRHFVRNILCHFDPCS